MVFLQLENKILKLLSHFYLKLKPTIPIKNARKREHIANATQITTEVTVD